MIIIRNGVDVADCPKINAYDPENPRCFSYIRNDYDVCDGNCEYVKNLKCENQKRRIFDKMISRIRKYKECIEEIKKAALPYKKEIKGICGECESYDDCHACCLDDINCYKYKSSNTEACNKFIPDLDPSVLTLNIILKRIEDLTNL